ncbi:TlpA family protein disulfide reductase [Duganella callida]|uniref:Thioredoxin domain-containing protein n=1 Tax=Duganella callida TaxID=2561932 RepID=A0A4Y9SIA5_9BURK|nr:hypothetical protein [Duganella callida]TFW21427.1 hypothetical protein E4L98_13305 [Duganella callida]
MMATLPAIATLCAGALAAPDIQPFETDGMARILADHAGRPFVVLVWSLDCGYCHASIKNLAAAGNAAAPAAAGAQAAPPVPDIVTVAIEAADDAQSTAAIVAATASLGPRAQRWAFGQTSAEQLRYQIDPQWRGELPRSYWYDASGKRVDALSGLITPQIIAAHR